MTDEAPVTASLAVTLTLVALFALGGAFCLGMAVGGTIAHDQLERDTDGWQHPPSEGNRL